MFQRINSLGRENSFAGHSKGLVLLVDEDREDLKYYRTILQAQGYMIRGCDSYEEATHLLGSERFDLVIVSQGGPNFEGRRVLEWASQSDRHLPLLVVARCLDMPCYLEAMQLGAADYIAWPVSMEQLGWAVETHLRQGAPV